MIPLYEDAYLAISKLRTKYNEQRVSKKCRHHERKFAHHALFILNELEQAIALETDKRGKNAAHSPFWGSRED